MKENYLNLLTVSSNELSNQFLKELIIIKELI